MQWISGAKSFLFEQICKMDKSLVRFFAKQANKQKRL